ncbi:MAG: EutN/CcmL family microcompartment protein [Candidatus Marinimicrobia bacterium]|nr:EutN/CcmL family microcompartment protein [Candidatus Neomarinimicrobiota bacterium]
MILGEVVGSVVSTVKDDHFIGQKLMLVQPTDTDGQPMGVTFIALDRVGAGKGDRVLVNREGGGTKIMFGKVMPVQAVIVGVVDGLEVTYRDA